MTEDHGTEMIARIRASAVCVVLGHLLVVRLCDPSSGQILHFVPGGEIEPGETPAQAARRETLEETGLAVRVESSSEVVGRYPYRWADTTYDVTTHFFRAFPERATNDLPTLAVEGAPGYQLGALWLPLARAEGLLGFDANIWKLTRALL